ncbi:hypothetical protein ACN263_10970 [Micromonospora sp. WMMD729]|uniref:hypothetical protein n=1 Tax=Micromonospora sp. WMMD729 TaxID=3404127 RepID=UPI003BF47226
MAQGWADQTAAEITGASTEQQIEVRQRLALLWQQRLADLVEEYPELGDEVRMWAADLRQQLPATGKDWVNTFIAGGNATQYNAPGGSITVTNRLGERIGS